MDNLNDLKMGNATPIKTGDLDIESVKEEVYLFSNDYPDFLLRIEAMAFMVQLNMKRGISTLKLI